MIQAIDRSSSDAHHHRAAEPERPPALLLLFRELADQDGNENDVVDAEDDFEKRQRDEREQAVGGEKGIHVVNVIRFA